MKVLIVCAIGVILCSIIIFYLLKILKNQKKVTKSIKYHSAFESKEPKGALLLYGFQFVVCFGFLYVIFMLYDFNIQNVITTIIQSTWQSKIIMVGFLIFLAGSCLYAMFEIVTHFNLQLMVENDTLMIRDKFGRKYIIDKSQIEFIMLGARHRRSTPVLTVKFVDKFKTYRFSMMMYWREFLLLGEWAKHHNITTR